MLSEDQPNRTLQEVWELADTSYYDNQIGQSIPYATGKSKLFPGDTLAVFLVREIKDNYVEDLSWAAQCDEIITALRKAQEDIEGVIDAFIAAH